MDEKQPYVAYLLRIWQVKSAGAYLWRASLEDPHTGERTGFADLESLLTFLRNLNGEKLEEEGQENM